MFVCSVCGGAGSHSLPAFLVRPCTTHPFEDGAAGKGRVGGGVAASMIVVKKSESLVGDLTAALIKPSVEGDDP